MSGFEYREPLNTEGNGGDCCRNYSHVRYHGKTSRGTQESENGLLGYAGMNREA